MRQRLESLSGRGREGVLRATEGVLKGASHLPESTLVDYAVGMVVALPLSRRVVNDVSKRLTGIDATEQLSDDRIDHGIVGARALTLCDTIGDLRDKRRERKELKKP